ncbi:MAG TPA: protein kinase [Anaerolineae bacterium]|nr:protein kinase [Anaerolineae bacterium]
MADADLFTNLFRQPPSARLHGRYLIKETLAAGQVSAVFRAVDSQDSSTEYAIKELSPVRLFRAEERREAEWALRSAVDRWSAIRHPAVPRIIETFDEKGKYYIAFEFVQGQSMRRIVRDAHIRVTPDLVCNWGAQLCNLLEHLHAQSPPLHVPFLGPGHVMVDTRGQVRVVDLGFTSIFFPNGYGPYGSVRGYSAPELASGPPSVRSDLFALGRLLYAVLVGQVSEEGLARRVPLRQTVPGVSGRLVKAIARAAHRDPERRPVSAAAMRGLLWDEGSGPVTPDGGRIELAATAAWSGPIASEPRSEMPQTMSDVGFVRDPRFGPEPADLAVLASPQTRPSLSVYPHVLKLGDLSKVAVKRVALSLRNRGDVEVVGRVISHVGWIAAPKKAVRLPTGRQAKVILTVRPALAPTGKIVEARAVSVDTNAGRQWIGVSLETSAGPTLSVEPSLLDFGTFQGQVERSLPLTVVNLGRETLTGRVVSHVPWLRVPHGAFGCVAGKPAEVAVHLVPEMLPRGEQRVDGALVVDSDGGQQRIQVHAWRLVPELDLGIAGVDFGAVQWDEVPERNLSVRNTGDGMLEGRVRCLVPWLRVYPDRFVCAPGELVQITLSADCAGLSDGILEIPQAVRVQTNAGPRSLSLRIEVRAPRLAIDTPSLDFGVVPLGEVRERPLVIRNEGSAVLEARVQSRAPWLEPSEAEVVCRPGQRVVLQMRADTRGFTRGQEIAVGEALQISWAAGVGYVPASVLVLQPSLYVAPPAVDFGYIDAARPAVRTLSITNTGTGDLAWNAQTDASWLEVSPESGICEAGGRSDLELTAYGLALDSGVRVASGTLIVNSDGGRAKVPLKVALASPLLATDVAFLDLGTSINGENVTSSFRIFNRGLGLLRGTIEPNRTWLVVDRASFQCDTGRSVEVWVTTDLEELPAGAMHGSGLVRVESNGGNAQIDVVVETLLVAQLQVVSQVVELVRCERDQHLQGRLTIKNIGRATARAELRTGLPELVLTRSRCDIKPGKSARIVVRWQGPLQPDPDRMYVDIVSDGQEIRVPAKIRGEALDIKSRSFG